MVDDGVLVTLEDEEARTVTVSRVEMLVHKGVVHRMGWGHTS